MNTITEKELADFFQNFPLYSKVKLFDNFGKSEVFPVLDFFNQKAFKFYCINEDDYHTFRIGNRNFQNYEFYAENLPQVYLDKWKKICFSFHLIGTCQSCDFQVDFLLNIFSEKAVSENDDFPSVFLRKIGQLPAFERSPEKIVLNYLLDEDRENYKKALSNLSVSFGIGAFAYFRRIIENEIKRFIADISELIVEHSDKIKTAWSDYEINHQMSALIDKINPYLPSSLKELGDNPLRLLYDQLSGGIHEFSEIECLEKAKNIDVLLRYVIKKVNSEKYELKEVRSAMKDLKGNKI